MFKVFVTRAVVSKGYEGAPAIRKSESGEAVFFKIGKSVYDKSVESKKRYINIAVKAFGPLCERIEKMGLKESSFINLSGKLDEDVWEKDGETHRRFVIIADEIEFAGGTGTGNGNDSAPKSGQSSSATPPATENKQNSQDGLPPGFNGYENFDDEDDFF